MATTKDPEKLRYLQHMIGSHKHVSISCRMLASEIGVERESIYIKLRRPFTDWKVGHLIIIADMLNVEFGDMVTKAVEYEKATFPVISGKTTNTNPAGPHQSKQLGSKPKQSPVHTHEVDNTSLSS